MGTEEKILNKNEKVFYEFLYFSHTKIVWKRASTNAGDANAMIILSKREIISKYKSVRGVKTRQAVQDFFLFITDARLDSILDFSKRHKRINLDGFLAIVRFQFS